MTDVREINDVEMLSEYREAWTGLLRATAGASFFQSLEWLEELWNHFSEGNVLRVFVVSENGAPVGIVPLVIRPVRTRLGWLRYLTYPLDEWGSSYGPIGADPGHALVATAEAIRQSRREWDVFELRWVDEQGTETGSTHSALDKAGLNTFARDWNTTAIIELSGTYDDYVKERSKNWRKSRRKNEARVASEGTVEFIRYRPRGIEHGEDDPRWDLYDMCQQVAEASWQDSSGTGTTMSHECIRPFLRDVHSAASRAGAVDLSLLVVDRQPVAFYYGYHYRGRFDALRTGFDKSFPQEGAGAVIIDRVIQDSFERGDRLIDQGPGSLEYKKRWCTTLHQTARYTYFAPTALRAQMLKANLLTKRGLSRLNGIPRALNSLVSM